MGISQYTFIKKNGEPSGTEYRSSIGRRRDCFYGRETVEMQRRK